jgi:hypothetical protein
MIYVQFRAFLLQFLFVYFLGNDEMLHIAKVIHVLRLFAVWQPLNAYS